MFKRHCIRNNSPRSTNVSTVKMKTESSFTAFAPLYQIAQNCIPEAHGVPVHCPEHFKCNENQEYDF